MQFQPGGAASLGFVIPLTKIDAEKRMIYGVAAQEVPDKAREIMDYTSARPQFEAWSQEFERATGGLSKGNLRVMHSKTVAGTIPEIAFDDDSKLVKIGAHVADDNEWRKCLAGAYTGFSIGGGYLRKWKDDAGLTRYTPIVREISLVDSPCVPTAHFAELVKGDGLVERIELRGVARCFADRWAARPRSFGESWAGRPRSFGELAKGMFREAIFPPPPRLAGVMAFSHLQGADENSDKEKNSVAGRVGARARQNQARAAAAPAAPPALPAPGQLGKAAYDNTKHPREHDGKFASKTAERVLRTVGGVGGAIGGAYLGHRHGPDIGHAVGLGVGRGINAVRGLSKPVAGMDAIRHILRSEEIEHAAGQIGRRFGYARGIHIGSALGAGVGFLAGSSAGSLIDRWQRRRRAAAAGRIEQHDQLNSHITVVPTSRKQARRRLAEQVNAAGKISSLGKAAWAEDKHPRGTHGRFADSDAAGPEPTDHSFLRTHDGFGGLAGFAGGSATGLGISRAVGQARWFSDRNHTAREITANRPLRREIVRQAGAIREAAYGSISDLAHSAYRKVMEEGAARGDPPSETAHHAARMAERVRRFKAGVNLAAAADRAVRNFLKSRNFHFPNTSTRGLILGTTVPLAALGYATGILSARRLNAENEGDSWGWNRLSDIGDVMRGAGQAALAGGATVAGLSELPRMVGSGARPIAEFVAGHSGKIGVLAGAAAGALSAAQVAHEWRARDEAVQRAHAVMHALGTKGG